MFAMHCPQGIAKGNIPRGKRYGFGGTDLGHYLQKKLDESEQGITPIGVGMSTKFL